MGLKENIKMLRTQKNMTLEDLAKIVGVSRQTIQRYESGVIGNIPSDKIELIAKALNTSPADLMGWGDDDIEEPIDIQQDKSIDEIINMLPGRIAKHTYTYSKLNDGNKSLVDVYTDKILDIQAMTDNIPIAAHERTDINVTNDMIKHDDDIMNDDNF